MWYDWFMTSMGFDFRYNTSVLYTCHIIPDAAETSRELVIIIAFGY